MKPKSKCPEGKIEVFTMYVTVKGKKRYRKDGKPFHFYANPR
jgi:hypothetical protein